MKAIIEHVRKQEKQFLFHELINNYIDLNNKNTPLPPTSSFSVDNFQRCSQIFLSDLTEMVFPFDFYPNFLKFGRNRKRPSFFLLGINIVRNSAWTHSSSFISIFYSTVQKKCKRNLVFFVLCSRKNSTKFHHEISSKRSRIFVESNEISMLSQRNFVLPNFCRRENSNARNFARAKIRIGDISCEKHCSLL